MHSFICLLSLAMMAVAQTLPKSHEVPYVILKIEEIYILVACVFGAIIELEIFQWLNISVTQILNDLMVRSIFYFFLAIAASEESSESRDSDSDHLKVGHITSMILSAAGIGFVISGSLYFVMALCCLKSVKEKAELEYSRSVRKSLERRNSGMQVV